MTLSLSLSTSLLFPHLCSLTPVSSVSHFLLPTSVCLISFVSMRQSTSASRFLFPLLRHALLLHVSFPSLFLHLSFSAHPPSISPVLLWQDNLSHAEAVAVRHSKQRKIQSLPAADGPLSILQINTHLEDTNTHTYNILSAGAFLGFCNVKNILFLLKKVLLLF